MPLRLAAFAILVAAVGGCSNGNPPPPVATASAAPSPVAGELRPLSSRDTAPPLGTAASRPAAVDPVDPAEPGIGDLPRLARYVFRTMRGHSDVCPFDNPYRDRIHFAFAVEVKAGRITRVGLGHAGLGPDEQARTLAAGQWPRELVAYVGCLEPHLRELQMDPAPADGTYEPVYQYPGRPEGRPAP